MVIPRAHKIRIDPNKGDEQFFRQCIGTARLAFNFAYDQWEDIFLLGGKAKESEIRRFLNAIKGEAFPWMSNLPKSIPQQAIKNLGTAYKRYFSKKSKKPKRKRLRDGRQSCRLDNGPGTIKIFGKKAWIPKLGWVKLFEPLRWESCRPMSLTLKREGERWFLVVSAEIEIPEPEDNDNQVVSDGAGDLGLTSALTVVDGEADTPGRTTKLAAPKPLAGAIERLARLQRRYARTKRGSANREKARRKVNRMHYKIRCIRSDWQHKTTHGLAKQYEVFYLEDLNVKGMMANHCLARAISDIGWGELKRQLSYKTHVVQVGRWFPSTQLCHTCAHKQKLSLTERAWTCEKCATTHDRDENAGKNILAEGRRIVILNMTVLLLLGGTASCAGITPQETGSLPLNGQPVNRSRNEESEPAQL